MGVNSCTVDKVCMVSLRLQFNKNFLTNQQKIIRNLVQILTCSCIGLRYSNSLRLLIIIRGVVKKNRIINRIRLTMIAVIHHFHLDLDRFSLKGNKFSQNYDLKLLHAIIKLLICISCEDFNSLSHYSNSELPVS